MGLRTVISNRRLLRQSWCQGPGLVRAGPSGEERGTPHYTVPVSPQCPQEISLLTLPVFQSAAVPSERFSQSLPPSNVAELGGSPPLRGSLEQLDRPSPAGPPLQGTELAALSTPETSLCGALPQPFYGVTPMLVGPEQALVMEQEVSTLLREETIEVVPALDKSPGSTAVLHCSWERGCVRLRSKLTEPLSHTTEVQKALLKHVSHTRSEGWWSRAI